MNFRTIVDIPKPGFLIEPLQPMLFVGSCFAENIGQRFADEGFPVAVNPYGVMYNPVSVFHTVERYFSSLTSRPSPLRPDVVFITLGTNHVYRLKETGEIVDNCQKRPQQLFQEEELTIAECVETLEKTVSLLLSYQPDIRVILTVSPIRYAKYGFHGSQLSKAVLLLAAQQMADSYACVDYFPAYEIVLDELRDYRFYQPDMLHPSEQAVEYIWEKFTDAYFSKLAKKYLEDWKPIKNALKHRPFHPDSEAYQQFLAETKEKEQIIRARYIINKV